MTMRETADEFLDFYPEAGNMTDDTGERTPSVPLAPAKRKQLGKLLVAPSEGSGKYGTRVLSPKVKDLTTTTTNNHGFSGGSCIAMDTVSSSDITENFYNMIKVSPRMQVATPSTDVVFQHPHTLGIQAQPEDDTENTQKLAIGTYRSTSVEVSGQLYNHESFHTKEIIANQTQPYSPERENVTLFIEKMQLQCDRQPNYEENTVGEPRFQFQDPDNVHPTYLPAMIQEIDTELEKPFPGENSTIDKKICEDFQAVNEKNERVFIEETVPCLGVQVRSDGPKPLEDLSHLNINLTTGNHQEDFQKTLHALLLQFAKKKADVIPSSSFKKNQVVFGTNKACKEMLDKSEFLPSHGTHGVILNDKLRPKGGQYTEDYHFSVKYVLGKGSFGEVKLCQDQVTKAKFVKKQVGSQYRKSEVEIMMALKHQNITQFYGVIQREGSNEIYMECAGISILTFTLGEDTKLLVTEEFVWNVNRQGLSALAYMEIYGIIHLDIKPENACILETPTGWTLKITDFGSAKFPQDPLSYIGWTAEYMSPEACISFLKSRYTQMSLQDQEDWMVTPKSDVFSWGLTMAFMYRKTHLLLHAFTNGQDNYKNVEDPTKVKSTIIVSLVKDPNFVQRCLIPDGCSPDMKQVLTGLLAGNPTQRLSAAEALVTIDKMNTEKLLSMKNPFPDLLEKDLDCFIYEPSEIPASAPGPVRVHRTSSVSSCVSSHSSISSASSYMSNASVTKKACPYKKSSKNMTGGRRRRILKEKLRDRIESPRNEMFGNLSPSVELDGNVPFFGALV
ncbi:uncharacterized protein LOC132565444 [Ylistrum balloti]|uniref:uncharacterized protein LOC132565444 n=1 Tax=Ylistrum balloti TaxID=509963 RepID=UPI00290599C8|nr:uncharacterized protein LOC132565444 [Ylistrum balloti]